MASSLTVGGTAFMCLPWPKPKIIRSILFRRNSAGYTTGSDRGAAQDIYETDVVFKDFEDNINSLETVLNNNRTGITLSSFNVPVFSPEVNHTGSISCAVTDFGRRKQVMMATNASSPTNNLIELEVHFRAISPALIGTTPSSSGLRLQDGWEAGRSVTVSPKISYDQTASYADITSDAGLFKASYLCDLSTTRKVLAYLLVTARATPVALSDFQGAVKYPFGVPKGIGPFNAVCVGLEISRQNLNRWLLSLAFAEAPSVD